MIADIGRHTSGVSVGSLHVGCVGIKSFDTSVLSGCSVLVVAAVQIAAPFPQPLRYAVGVAEQLDGFHPFYR